MQLSAPVEIREITHAASYFNSDRFKWLAPSPGDEERPTAFPQEGEQARGLYLIFDREKK